MTFYQELKRRNIFRVAIAYAVIAWLLLQVGGTLAPALLLPEWINTALAFFLILGFPLAIFLAWAFELTPEGIRKEKDVDSAQSRTKVTGGKIDYLIIIMLVVALGYFMVDKFVLDPGPDAGLIHSKVQQGSDELSQTAEYKQRTRLPLVIMMDSHHESRVYDEDTLSSGGTNADVVSDILLDLPISRQKEAVSPDWHRDEDILGFQPDLVIIHISSFKVGHGKSTYPRIRLFIEFLIDTETRFILYSRRDEPSLQAIVDEMLVDLINENPELQKRVHVFGLSSHGDTRWRDPAIAVSFKLLVKKVLELE
jgi:hypothetical protein